MLRLGPHIDRDQAPVVLQQSRLQGLTFAAFGVFLLWVIPRFVATNLSILCNLPTALMILLGGFSVIDGLRRVVAPQSLIVEPSGITFRNWRSERKLAWTDVGGFTPSQWTVFFTVRQSMDGQRPPLIGSGYWMFPSAMAEGLRAARERWAHGVPEPQSVPMTARGKVILLLIIIGAISLTLWSHFAHPFASCRASTAVQQQAGGPIALCPADLLVKSKDLIAWT